MLIMTIMMSFIVQFKGGDNANDDKNTINVICIIKQDVKFFDMFCQKTCFVI